MLNFTFSDEFCRPLFKGEECFGFESPFSARDAPYQASWQCLPVNTGDPLFPAVAVLVEAPLCAVEVAVQRERAGLERLLRERVFVYLQPEYPGLTAVLSALAAAKARIVPFVPGLAAQTRDALRNRRLVFAERPLRMDVVRDQCEAAICHAGLGTATCLLGAGRPMLLLPTQLEQGMIAIRTQQLGAGLVCDDQRIRTSAALLVQQLLERRELLVAAQRFAQQYRDRPQEQAVAAIVDESLALLT